MVRLIATLGIVLMALSGVAGCDLDTAPAVSANDIIVYGATTCANTTGLMADLDDAGLPYTFKDVETDASAEDELLAKLQTTNWYEDGETVAMPIVDVKGTLLEQPSLEEVEDSL